MPEYEVTIRLVGDFKDSDEASQAFWEMEDANPEVTVRLIDDEDEAGTYGPLDEANAVDLAGERLDDDVRDVLLFALANISPEGWGVPNYYEEQGWPIERYAKAWEWAMRKADA